MLLTVLKYLLIALEVLVIFNLIIIVHELGHFLAARWRGLVVEEFGVWFGKPLWRKKIGGVWYSLGSIPAGGFVKLPQMAPMESLEGESDTPREQLPAVRPLNKIIVAFAGPLFSFLLALALGAVVWAVGKPTHEIETTTVIGEVLPGGPGEKAGLKPGDKVLAIDGKPVKRFHGALDSVVWNVIRSEGDTIDFLVERDGQQMHIPSGWTKEETPGWKRKPHRKVMIGPRITPEIGALTPGGPAEKAGLRPGDVVTEANGTPTFTISTLWEVLGKAPDAPVALRLQRGAETIETTLTPVKEKIEGQMVSHLGIEWGRMTLEHPTPFQQVGDSVRMMVNMIDGLISRKSDIKVQHFSGPVGIMNVYRKMFEAEEGWRFAIAFSVFFNVNLALLNLLPFPVLDGGHITFAIVEAIRRRPIMNVRALEMVQTACAMALIAFMLYVTFFDVGDFIPGRKKPAAPPASGQTVPEVSAPKSVTAP
jgi:regulator of sigma E protease